MRTEEPETSLPLLLSPLGLDGIPQDACTDIARDTDTGFRYFTSLCSAFPCRICFLLQALLGNLKFLFIQEARAAAKHLLRLMGSSPSTNMDGNNLPGADRLTYRTAALAPTRRRLVPTAT